MTNRSLPAWVAGLLPPLQSSNPLPLSAGDIVIHAPGFEDRTIAIKDSVVPEAGARAVLLDYLPFNPNNRLRDVRDALSAAGVKVAEDHILKYDRFGPGDFEARLKERVLRDRARGAVIDIS